VEKIVLRDKNLDIHYVVSEDIRPRIVKDELNKNIENLASTFFYALKKSDYLTCTS